MQATHKTTYAVPDVFHGTRAGKEVTELVETGRHYPVCGQERFFNPVTMVDINVNVQHSVVHLDKARHMYWQCQTTNATGNERGGLT